MKNTCSRHAGRSLPRAALVMALALPLLACLASCSPRIGWGVVLWTVKGTDAKAGSVVPVYLKSNIMKVYVIGLSGKKPEKIEVPIWQLEMFRSKGAANKRVAQMQDLVSVYMIADRDGLPVRQTPTNGAKRVYRLRENEMVKALRRVEGDAVFTGSQKLQGDWYEVLAADGTRGYVFSNTMRMFDENSGQAPEQGGERTDAESVDAIFSRTWRPAWYAPMLNEGSVDLDYFSLRFGLFCDAANKQVRVELPSLSKVFQYKNISQDKDWLVFDSTDLRIRLESPTSLLAAWGPVAADAPDDSAGWKVGDSFVRFIATDADIRGAIRAEESRRSEALRAFFSSAAAAGAVKASAGVLKFGSESAGTFELWPSGLYSWQDASSLPAGFAPIDDQSGAAQKGTVVFGLRLSGDLLKNWQGGLSLYSDSTGQRADYVYKMESKELTLARAVASPPGAAVSDLEKRMGAVTLEFSGKQ